MNEVNFSKMGLTPPEALVALFNYSKRIGMGFLSSAPNRLSVEDAAKELQKGRYIDYLRGRLIKCGFTGSLVDTTLYDRDFGNGAGEMALMDYATDPNR